MSWASSRAWSCVWLLGKNTGAQGLSQEQGRRQTAHVLPPREPLLTPRTTKHSPSYTHTPHLDAHSGSGTHTPPSCNTHTHSETLTHRHTIHTHIYTQFTHSYTHMQKQTPTHIHTCMLTHIHTHTLRTIQAHTFTH